jgi:GMP reductase
LELRNYEKDLEPAKQGLRADFITIDVAHGHHEMMKRTIGWIREHIPNAKIIAGNVATGDGVEFLANLGVDAVKVGIGGGGICTTRYKTGFHLPTLHSVYVANQFLHVNNLYDIPIIADGGAKHYGDISKALTFGAAMVMSGGWFASCIDSPAKIENGKKIYRGSTSFAAKGENRHVEGKTLELDSGDTYLERMTEIQQSLQSAISYAGGTDLHAFDFVNYERVDPRH